jgi:PIF1-like helicase
VSPNVRYLRADVIVLDEASMISPQLFDLFESICRTLRRNEAPFGGMQVVLSGDFFQLPPIVKQGRLKRKDITPESLAALEKESRLADEAEKSYTSPYFTSSLASTILGPEYDPVAHSGYTTKIDLQTKYIFDSMAWKRLMMNGMQTVILNEAFRQSDPKFVALLDDLRLGSIS